MEFSYNLQISKRKTVVVTEEWAVLLWYYHTKTLELDFETFYNRLTWQILNEKGYFEEIIVPLAAVINIKNGVCVSKFYKTLQKIKPLSPSEMQKLRK